MRQRQRETTCSLQTEENFSGDKMSELKITNNRGENKVASSLLDTLQKKKDGVTLAGEDTSISVYNVEQDIIDLVQHELSNVNAFGDRIGYFVTPTVVPGPNGQPMPVVMVMLETKSVVLGQRAQVTTFIPTDGDRRAIVKSTVPNLIEELQKVKDEIANQSTPE